MRTWNELLQKGVQNGVWNRIILEKMATDYKSFKSYLESGRLLDTFIDNLTIEERQKLRGIAIGHKTPRIIEKDADIPRPSRMSGELFDLPR
jgi:hypothetical protein